MSEKLTSGLRGNFNRFLPDTGLVLEGGNISGTNLLDLQVNGSSKFSVDKNGDVSINKTGSLGPYSIYLGNQASLYSYGSAYGIQPIYTNAPGGLALLATTATLMFGPSGDAILSRKAAANLRFGAADVAAPVAQTLSVQSVVAGTSNTAGANLTIQGSQSTGTGAGGSIIFQIAPAGTAANGTVQNALADALTINSDLSTRLESGLNFYGTGTVSIQNNANFMFLRAGTYRWGMGQEFIVTSSTAYIGWSSGGTDIGGVNAANIDTKLFRDAANTVAQRNGTANQTSRIYGTYTDASNYERLSLSANSTAAYIQTENAGTGLARPLYLGSNNATTLTIDTSGRVGISTTSPTTTFDVRGTTDQYSFQVPSTGSARYVRSQTGIASFSGYNLGLLHLSGTFDSFGSVYNGAMLGALNASAWSNTNSPAHMILSTTPYGSTTPSEKLRITSNGEIGISITVPTAKLAVANGTSATTQHNYGTYTDGSNYERIAITANSSGHYIIGEEGGTGSPRPLYLGSNNAIAATIDTASRVGIGTTSPAAQFHLASKSANSYSTQLLQITSNTGTRISTIKGDGRFYVGSDNGYNVVFSVDNKGEKKDSSYTMLVKDTYNLLMSSTSFVSDSPDFSFGANNFGGLLEFISPAGNGMIRNNRANTTIGQGSQAGSPDKTLRVWTTVANNATSLRVRESDWQGTQESFGVYANNDTTPRLVVANGNVGVGTTSPTSNLHVIGTANITSNLVVQGVDVIQAIANVSSGTIDTTARNIANSAFAKANAAITVDTLNGANTAVGSGANAFTSATIAGANTAVGAGANAFTTAATTGANAFTSATIAGANTAIGAGANAFTSATIAGANTAVGAGANTVGVAAFAKANSALANTSGISFNGNLNFPSGNVGIGTANATSKLHVVGTANITSNLVVQGVDVLGAITSANTYANSTFLKLTGGTINGDVSIVGNLALAGNTNFINVSTYVVSDPLIYLASNNYSSDIVDIGFIANYVNVSGSNVHTGMFRDATSKEFYVFQEYNQEPVNNVIDPAGNNFTLAVLNADIRTSNLILGGANAISLINSAFTKANSALANTSGVSFNGNLNFPSGNVGIGIAATGSKLHIELPSSVANQIAAKFTIASNNLITLGERANLNYGGFLKLHDGLGGSGNFIMEYNGGFPQFTTTGGGHTFSFTGSGGGSLRVNNAYMDYITNSVTRFIVYGGNVGIANTTPDSKLVVQDTLTGNGSTVQINPTWNNASSTFTALKMNITDTASGSSSLLMDLQVGGTSQFTVGKNSRVGFTSVSGNNTKIYGLQNGGVYFGNVAGTYGGFSSSAAFQIGTSLDVILTRKAAANLQFGAADAAAPVGQTLSVQSVVAGTSNTAGANLTIQGSQSTGTAAGGSIIFQVAPAGTAANGTVQNALATALTIDSAGFLLVAGTNNGFNSRSGQTVTTYISGVPSFDVQAGAVCLRSLQNIAWATSDDASNSLDLRIFRDTSNILAQRNDLNAQTLRVYGTYTDSSNYERLSLSANSTAAYIQTERAGTGTARPLYLGANNTIAATIDTAGRVGIGTSNPTEQLHISGNTIFDTTSSERKIITNGGGYIKFGQNSASNKKLSVGGFSDGVYFDQSISFTANQTGVVGSSGAALLFGTSSGPNDIPSILIKGSQGNDPANPVVRIWDTSSYATHRVLGVGGGTTYSEYLTVLNSGNTGIGITSPTSKLHVVGTGNITSNLVVQGVDVVPTIIAAFAQANTVGSSAAYDQANAAYTQANSAFAQANTGGGGGSTAAYDQANAAYTQANSAFTKANNALANTSGVSFNGNLNFPTGNVGIGTSAPAYKLEVNGAFAATTKSFVINHPTKSDMKLRYGSLEGPENGVYIRGRSKSCIIELPDYWTGLVHEDSITISLTPIGKHQKLYVKSTENNTIIIGSDNLFGKDVDYYYTIFAERKDVEKLLVEI